MDTLNYIINLKNKSLNFNSMVVLKDNIYALLGVNINTLESLLKIIKSHLKNSSKRNIRNCLAIFLLKLHLGISQKVLAVKNQNTISRTISSVKTVFMKSGFVDDNIGFNHVSREDLLEKHMYTGIFITFCKENQISSFLYYVML